MQIDTQKELTNGMLDELGKLLDKDEISPESALQLGIQALIVFGKKINDQALYTAEIKECLPAINSGILSLQRSITNLVDNGIVSDKVVLNRLDNIETDIKEIKDNWSIRFGKYASAHPKVFLFIFFILYIGLLVVPDIIMGKLPGIIP